MKEKRNALVVAEHPDFSLKPDGPNRFVVEAKNVDVLGGLPCEWGGAGFNLDPVHRIPIEESRPRHRHPMRSMFKSRFSHVGLVARNTREDTGSKGAKCLVMLCWPGVELDVAVEAPELA